MPAQTGHEGVNMDTIENVDRGASNIVVSTVLLTKPGIITSVAFTGFAGMVLASKGFPSIYLAVEALISLLLERRRGRDPQQRPRQAYRRAHEQAQ